MTVGDAISLNIKTRLQLRYQLDLPNAGPGEDQEVLQSVSIGTARLYFSGHIFRPELTYLLQLAVAGRDYRDGATSPIFDAFVDWKIHRDFALRVGQFFVPFDRLRTVREFALQLADRPRPVSELTLDRDAGVVFYSEHLLADRSPVAVRLGVFGGGGTNLTTSKPIGALLLARLELRPLGPIDDDSEGDLERRTRPGLALGAGFAQNFNTDRVKSTTGAHFAGGTVDYTHFAADLVFKWRGIAIQGEYLWRTADSTTLESVDDAGLPIVEYTREGQGWIVQASYTFDPPVELVARLSRMYAFEGTDPAYVAEVEARGQEVAAGVNYYFNGHKLKAQLDWIARMPPAFEVRDADHAVHFLLDGTF